MLNTNIHPLDCSTCDVHIMYLNYKHTEVGMTQPPSRRVFSWETGTMLSLKYGSEFPSPDAKCVPAWLCVTTATRKRGFVQEHGSGCVQSRQSNASAYPGKAGEFIR